MSYMTTHDLITVKNKILERQFCPNNFAIVGVIWNLVTREIVEKALVKFFLMG